MPWGSPPWPLIPCFISNSRCTNESGKDGRLKIAKNSALGLGLPNPFNRSKSPANAYSSSTVVHSRTAGASSRLGSAHTYRQILMALRQVAPLPTSATCDEAVRGHKKFPLVANSKSPLSHHVTARQVAVARRRWSQSRAQLSLGGGTRRRRTPSRGRSRHAAMFGSDGASRQPNKNR